MTYVTMLERVMTKKVIRFLVKKKVHPPVKILATPVYRLPVLGQNS